MGAAGSGKIGKYEFRTALRNLNLGVGMQDIVDRLFCEIDADGSGSITFQEFAEAMKPESNESEVIISRISKKHYSNETTGCMFSGEQKTCDTERSIAGSRKSSEVDPNTYETKFCKALQR
eukprot:Stramenopile-MAST_4_protein_3153